jgi:dienelactone hydrolase
MSHHRIGEIAGTYRPAGMRLRRAGVVVLIAASIAAGCSDDDTAGSVNPASTHRRHAVGVLTETFVDTSRTTPVNGTVPARPQRTLETEILYPAHGDASTSHPVEGAAADASGGPYPLIVFAHGFGATFEFYETLLQRWAAAGFVIAAPHFPLTYANTDGGINAADVERQPGDVSFVIDEVLAASKATTGALAGMVDPDAIAIAGHSNGGITTLGAVANSCCRDTRAKAAVVLSGVDSPYSSGRYDLTTTPPILWVHGKNDEVIVYGEAVRMFNAARGPKGLLTLDTAGHGDWLAPASPAFATAVKATTDFLDAYLRGNGDAKARLPNDQRTGTATMRFAADTGSTLTVPTVPTPAANRSAVASQTMGLRHGQTVTVSWTGFLPGKTVNIVQCTGKGDGGTATCDLLHGRILQPDPTGEGSLPLTIQVGTVANGVCDATHPCSILVNDAGLQQPEATIYIPITFAP